MSFICETIHTLKKIYCLLVTRHRTTAIFKFSLVATANWHRQICVCQMPTLPSVPRFSLLRALHVFVRFVGVCLCTFGLNLLERTWKMDWSNDKVLEFIECYRNENVLWDRNDPEHANRTAHQAAWDRIRSDFSLRCSIVDLKRKKESLMAMYRHVLKKIKQGMIPGKVPYRTSWFAFPAMHSFLGNNYSVDVSDDQIMVEVIFLNLIILSIAIVGIIQSI